MKHVPWHRKVADVPWWAHIGIGATILTVICLVTAGVIVQSDAYAVAKPYALNNPAVIEVTGLPASARLGLGAMSFQYSDTYSSIRIPMAVSGPRGTASVNFHVVRRGGNNPWVIEQASFYTDTYERDLMGVAK
jgi:hypothetical protein